MMGSRVHGESTEKALNNRCVMRRAVDFRAVGLTVAVFAVAICAVSISPVSVQADLLRFGTTLNESDAYQKIPLNDQTDQGSDATGTTSASVAQASTSSTYTQTTSSADWSYSESYSATNVTGNVAESDTNHQAIFGPSVNSTFTLTTTWTGPSVPGFYGYNGYLEDLTTNTYLIPTLAANTVYTGSLTGGDVYHLFQTDYIESNGTPSGNTGSATGDVNLTAVASPAPEPSSAVLAGLGAVVLVAGKLRRSRRPAGCHC